MLPQNKIYQKGPLTPKIAKRTKLDISQDGVLQFLEPLVAGKKVLDLGCIEHGLSEIHQGRIWVHDFLVSKSKEVTGVDYLREEVGHLKNLGYKIVCQNVEELNLAEKFEVIFAGELIEHLNNPGKFLEKVRLHLERDGIFILTTPNTFSLQRLFSILSARNNDPGVNLEHTFFFTPSTIKELFSRFKLEVTAIKYTPYPVKQINFEQRLIRLVNWAIGDCFHETMIVAAKQREVAAS